MRKRNWWRVALGAFILGGAIIAMVTENAYEVAAGRPFRTGLEWPAAVLGGYLLLLGLRPHFPWRESLWAVILLGGFGLLIAGIGGWPEIGGVDASPFGVLLGIALVIGDGVALSRGDL